MLGQVSIASMNMRGKWATKPSKTVIVVNATSAQSTSSQYRRDLSPMTERRYKGYWNFEHYWQAGKVYADINKEAYKKWWKDQTSAKRRYPGSKGMKVLHAQFDGEEMDYVTSRKKVYVPEYEILVRDTKSIRELTELVKNGVDVVVYDFDGPRTDSGDVSCCEVDVELLTQKINDTRFPFGHGYVVAALIAGIDSSSYIS